MKSLIESILDDDFADVASDTVEPYVKEVGNIISIVDFTKNYFEKLYKGQKFYPINIIRHQANRKQLPPKDYERSVLKYEGYDDSDWKTDYHKFKNKLLEFIKSKDKDLYHRFHIDDKVFDDIEMYIDDCPISCSIGLVKSHKNPGCYNIISCKYVYPEEFYFAWERSEDGGVKISTRVPNKL